MAPEQVRGLTADARADLFALGVVLHEMLSGDRAFLRGTAAETMTAILNDDTPDLATGVRPVPAASTASFVIAWRRIRPSASRPRVMSRLPSTRCPVPGVRGALPPTAAGRRSRERVAWAVVTMALAALAGWLAFSRPAPGASTEVYRASIVLPEGVSLRLGSVPAFDLRSPRTATTRIYRRKKDRARALWIQSLGDASAIAIDGSQDAETPFWSHDSKTVGFVADRRVMKVNAAGGRPQQIASGHGTAAWSPDGQEILLADEQSGVRAISVADGSTRVLISPRSGVNSIFPVFLPDGRRFLFGRYEIGSRTSYGWYGGDLNGTTPVLLKQAQIGSDNTNAKWPPATFSGSGIRVFWQGL